MITAQGYILPTFEEIYERKISDFKSVKPDLRLTDSNLIVPLLKFDAAEEYDLHLKALQVFNNLNVYTAVGASLNNITSHLNMTWLKARKAVGTIKIFGKNGTEIPKGYVAETESGIKFITIKSGKILRDYIEIEIEALNAGATGNVDAGQIVKQTTVINGITSIKNTIQTTGGREKENDTELRERYLKRLKQKSSFTTEGIKQYILKNTNVAKCQVLENEEDIKDEMGHLPHSYECICLGDLDDNIFKTLYEYKIAGIRTVGDKTKKFGAITIGFSRPINVNIDITISLSAFKEIWKDRFKTTIENIIKNYISGLDINDTIYSYKILGEIYKNTQGIKNIDIKIKKTNESQTYTDLSLKAKEVAVLNQIHVNIND